MNAADLAVKSLGPCRIDSPLKPLVESRRTGPHYVGEDDRVLYHDTLHLAAAAGVPVAELPGFEPAGPRQKIFLTKPVMWSSAQSLPHWLQVCATLKHWSVMCAERLASLFRIEPSDGR